MTKRFDLKLENCAETSLSVVQRYRQAVMQDFHHESLALVHYRGGEAEFQIANTYLNSKDSLDRAVGADILGQLGWSDKTYHHESIELLIPALQDPDDFVIYSACCALGHRADSKATAHVIKLMDNANSEIRYGVVCALLGLESNDAIAAMITLTQDADSDVRSWAMFGLGSQIEVDNTDIREALFSGTADEHLEVRGEALIGLATRKDARLVELLLSEWGANNDVGILSLEAAQAAANPRLYAKLLYLRDALGFTGDEQFDAQMIEAIKACKPRIESVTSTKH